MKRACLSLVLLLMVAACAGAPVVDGANADSPKGQLAAGTEVTSPDKRFKVRLESPGDSGHYSILETATNQKTDVQIGVSNSPSKGIAISPDSRLVAVMHHEGPGGFVAVYELETGREAARQPIRAWFHHIRFADPQTLELKETAGPPVQLVLSIPKS